MQVTDLIKNVVVPLISVATAAMVAILNYQVSSSEQAITRRLNDIDLLVKQSKELREERESTQDFHLRIYDIVTQSLEEANTQKQEAAKAFIVVMVDEPLRSSLLNVLRQGGQPAVRREISRILHDEQVFNTSVATVPRISRTASASYAWGEWDIDVFWCAESGSSAQRQAEKIAEQLLAEGAQGRVRVRELPASINARAGYQIEGYAIQRSIKEEEAAIALKSLAEKALHSDRRGGVFHIGLTRQDTPWYLSAFICPVPAS